MQALFDGALLRLPGAASPGHVRNAPLATVGPKKAACRDGPRATFLYCEKRRVFCRITLASFLASGVVPHSFLSAQRQPTVIGPVSRRRSYLYRNEAKFVHQASTMNLPPAVFNL